MAPPLNSLFDDFASSLETERQWQTPFESGMVILTFVEGLTECCSSLQLVAKDIL